jgi:hypothetical protein
MVNLRRVVLLGIVAIGLASWARLPVAMAADGPAAPAAPAADVVPVFGEPAVDSGLAKVVKETEIAVMQYKNLRTLHAKTVKANSAALNEPLAKAQALQTQLDEATKKSADQADTKALAEKLAAAKQELDAVKFVQRERLSWAVVDILYPGQIDLFQGVYEEQVGEPARSARRMAQARLKVIMGIELPPPEGEPLAENLMALVNYYGPVCTELTGLKSAYKDRMADKAALADYQSKRDAIVKRSWARSLEIVNGLMTPEQRTALAAEWLRIQDRRADWITREFHRHHAVKTDAQKKQVEAIGEALRAASRTMDLEDPQFEVLRDKAADDMAAAVKE